MVGGETAPLVTYVIRLTFDIIVDVQDSTLAADAPHRVSVLDVAHE